MRVKYLAALAISSMLGFGAVVVPTQLTTAQANPCAAVINPCAAVNPCAAADPCAAAVNPCAAADPCAAVNPCAAADPCAAAANPCAAANVGKSGTFVASAQSASGQAWIVEENGQRYLEFDQDFRSDNGPDLFVLLHEDAVPQTYGSDEYVNLGVLKSVAGTQRYEIPANVSLEDFKSAVIWCREFNVTFSYASLG